MVDIAERRTTKAAPAPQQCRGATGSPTDAELVVRSVKDSLTRRDMGRMEGYEVWREGMLHKSDYFEFYGPFIAKQKIAGRRGHAVQPVLAPRIVVESRKMPGQNTATIFAVYKEEASPAHQDGLTYQTTYWFKFDASGGCAEAILGRVPGYSHLRMSYFPPCNPTIISRAVRRFVGRNDVRPA